MSLLSKKDTRSGWMGCTRIKRRQTLSWLTAGSELSGETNNWREVRSSESESSRMGSKNRLRSASETKVDSMP